MASNSIFSQLLRKSPLQPLQEHMRVVNECVCLVPQLFEALIAQDQSKVELIKQAIDQRESEADLIKNQIRAHLPNSLMMPVNRVDILQVLQMQDAIADTAEDIANLLVVRKTDVPEALQAPLLELIGRCVDACDQTAKIIEELDELLAVGFQGQEASRVSEMVETLSTIESETDDLGRKLAKLLFDHEDEMKPVAVVIWYQLIQWIGDIADHAEDVGDRVRLLVAR